MSYRVDIPTLSTNEVYTLTFEYEGTETIQLIVGDLTLETTDRRVVFTTTSPVNYIESNMNLTNLNIYEGYYESDDFGGEYTQESYIEGKSLINYKRRVDYGTLINNANIRETFTDDGYINYKQLGTGATGSGFRGNGFVSGIDQSKNYTIILRVRKNTFPTDVFVPFTLCHFNYGVKFDEAVKGGHWGISYNISGKQTGVWKAVVKGSGYNVSMSARYWGILHSFLVDENSEVTDLTQRTDIVGCEIEYAIEVLQGDYFDIDTGIDGHFEGIGCVKSPRVISREQPLNMFYCTNWTSTLNNGTVTCQDGKFYFDGSFGGYTYFDIINGGKVKNNIYLEPGKYFAKVKAHSKEPCVSNGMCISVEATMENGVTLDLCGVYTSKDNIYSGVTSAYKEFTSPIVKLTLKIWYGGNGSNNIIIDGIYFSKTNMTDDLAFKENHVVTTPDDLELYCNYYYDRNTKKSSPCYQDTLDLTTGTITRKNIKVRLNDYIAKYGSVEGALATVNGSDMVRVKYNHMNSSTGTFPVQIEGEVTGLSVTGIVLNASQGGYDGTWFTTSDIEHAYTNTNIIFMYFNPSRFDGIDYTDSTTIKNWLIEQDFTLIIKIHNASVYTEQLPTSLNALKSYRNGSIQTSSQQLAPTLKTTLPVSNKFTTTNLTSGATYNIYFDGTATKLDAGGTIITDPVSPCEVECGGTTLTIEGTDIQNVRVLETTNKNEVGSVCGTTDVELSVVECMGGGIPNLLSTLSTDWENGTDYGVCIRYKYGIDVRPNEKYVFTVSNTDGLTYKEIAIWNTDQWVSNAESIITTQRLTANTPYILTVPSGVTKVYIYFPYDSSGNLNQAHEYELRMQKGTVDLGYGGQKEATIPLVCNCNLGQPIKLRSLGTTYDSYNPVTGELVKRIGVSETDGSYSVLSSPLVIKTTTDKFFDDFGNEWLSHNSPITNIGYYVDENSGELIVSDKSFYTDYLPVPKQTIKIVGENRYKRAVFYNASKQFVKGLSSTSKTNYDWLIAKDQIPTNAVYVRFSGSLSTDSNTNYTPEPVIFIVDNKGNVIKMAKLDAVTIPQLYTNGQVKVYSESDVYPTTILNGQSTNNYEVNELNRYNNYTIRYDGECESINLANKSNEQGTNRIVKSGTDGRGNLTFVNDSGDIDNVLLVEHDVREQEINHFNGLQTVEISQIFAGSKQNLFEQYMKADYDYTTSDGLKYSSLHNGVFKCGDRATSGQNQQKYWAITKPHIESFGHASVYSGAIEDEPIMVANKIYHISFTMTVTDGGGHDYNLQAYGGDKGQGSILKWIKPDNVQTFLSVRTTGGTVTQHISQEVWCEKDVNCIAMYSPYSGGWEFDCTITDLTICEPENAKPNVPLVYEYIDLPQPVQLNRIHKENMPYSVWSNVLGHPVNLADGIAYDSYNPITGEYIQRVYKMTLNGDDGIRYIDNWSGVQYAIDDSTLPYPRKAPYGDIVGRYAGLINVDEVPYGASYNVQNDIFVTWLNYNAIVLNLPRQYTNNIFNQNACKQWLRENPITLYYELETPIVTQLTPITIPAFEGGIVQLITTDGKVFPMIEYSMPTNNRYDTSSWETGAVYTQRNMTEAYFNESTTPMIPTETMTLTTDHISSGSIILNDNGNGLIVLKGNYTGRDIPYFTGMRSVEAIEVETTPSPDQPLFGKGGRK